MKTLLSLITLSAFFMIASALPALAGSKESALSWQKQAIDTRVIVASVIGELDKTGDKGNDAAKDLIADAKMWMEKADEIFSKADGEMGKKDFEKAGSNYNMAWQYLVKSATAALNAKSILGGS
ncbi:MAG: hypothetical protein IH874_07770 [Candidatus Dadabacteria bacterium]|nr:hypothetical protein [Candidatus Dadabacteria bacterium]